MNKAYVVLLAAFIVLAFAHCASAHRIHASEPVRLLRQHFEDFNAYAFFDFDVGNTTSNCGSTTCKYDTDCPVFSEFYRVECAENGTCEYEQEWTHDLCNVSLQCNTGTCECAAYLTDGCKCNYYGEYGACEDVCINNICQPAFGFLGDTCDAKFTCDYGVCQTNTCTPLQEGASCTNNDYNLECATGLYCDSTTCQILPPCSTENPFNGSCPSLLDLCVNGTCFPYSTVEEGGDCNVNIPMCMIGLQCVPISNGSADGTCEHIPQGTPCTQDNDCEYFTQNCLCVEHSDNATKQCVDSGYGPCAKIFQVLNVCMQNYCLYYDLIPGTTCYTECNQYNMEALCCSVCNNPQYYNNAAFNIAGTCAQNNLKSVECCDDKYPCTVLSVTDMCAGYI